MTQYSTLYQEVQKSIGRDSAGDAFAVTVCKRGINIGLFAAALMFEPPELRSRGDLTALSTQDYVLLSGLTRCYRVESVYNSTGENHVYPIPYNRRNMYWLPTSGDVQFWCLYGNTLYYNPTPSASQTLQVSFLGYPVALDADADVFPFPTLEGYVLALGTEYAWGCLEEPESTGVWNKLAEKYGIPETIVSTIRRRMGEEVSIDNI